MAMPTSDALLTVPYDPAEWQDCPRGLPLYRKGGGVRAYVLVDADDYYLLTHWKWFLHGGNARKSHWYAARWGDNGEITLMHREILSLPTGVGSQGPYVDHINRNTLDNRRANLRIVTPAENAQNRGAWGRLGYRGVHETRQGRFMARAGAGGKIRLGTFDTPEEAAAAAQAWREGNMPVATD